MMESGMLVSSLFHLLLSLVVVAVKSFKSVVLRFFKKLVGIDKLEKAHKAELASQREAIINAMRGDNFETVEGKIVVPEEVEDMFYQSIRRIYGKDESFVDEVMGRMKDEYNYIFDMPNYAYDMALLGTEKATNKLVKYYADKIIKERIALLPTHDLEKYFMQVAYLNSLHVAAENVALKAERLLDTNHVRQQKAETQVATAVSKVKTAIKGTFGLDPCEVDAIILEAGLDPATIDRTYINDLLSTISKQIAEVGYVGQKK